MAHYGSKELAQSFRTVRKNTLEAARDIPQDKYDFRATPDCRSVEKLLTHIALSYRFRCGTTHRSRSCCSPLSSALPRVGLLLRLQALLVTRTAQNVGQCVIPLVTGVFEETIPQWLERDLTSPRL